ncbi:MAG: adenylate/guanylate cyclase domain-containing protein [Alphaproteobacteria bacterium]|nr:MAG: adenylate/guanylate cyclase domain-containing protein [Alphaproteobacteria bacterium]
MTQPKDWRFGKHIMAEDRVERRLAAILAADVAGYSRLMGADEEGTLAALKAHRRAVLDPKITEHRGRIVKTTGDGLLVEFASVVDAVRCAVDIQRQMAERNAGVAAEQRIEFRIGLNVGDIIIDDKDIYGDGVNIAARLEGLAAPGGICVSRVVRDQVRDKLDFSFEDMGEQQVKNIARPVRTHRVRLDSPVDEPSAAAVATTRSAQPLPQKPSIAVLPFANMSGDAEQEYFSEGITEDIITNLSHNHAFFVISRSTSFAFKGPAVDVGKIGRELGVRYVLEGSVRRAGNRVRITAQLIEAASGHHLWADRYDRELADVFAVQDEISRSITGAIAPGIIAAEIRQAQRKGPDQLDAWDRTVRAHWHIRRFTQVDLAEARRLLEEAIDLDPTNSMAYADLAFARHFEAVFGWGDGPAESHVRLGEAARNAVAADDSDAMAHTALAIFDLFSNRHEEARRRLQRALELNPNSEFARGYLGGSYAFGGDYEAALANLEEAIRLSPRSQLLVIWHLCEGWAALTAERHEEAVVFAARAREANPEFPDIYAVLASAYGHLGNATGGMAALDQLSQRMPGLTASDERLSRPFARASDRDRYLEGLRKAGIPA